MTSLPIIGLCLKPVRRVDMPVRPHPDGGHLREEECVYTANPADLAALHWAMALREQAYAGKARVIAWSLSPRAGEEILRFAVACGVDEANRIWLRDGEEEGRNAPWLQATRINAHLLGEAIQSHAPRLVITGDRSRDHGSEGFGAFLAHELGAAFARRAVTIERQGTHWRVQARVARGYRQTLDLTEPAVLTVPHQGTHPPDPSLPQWIKSRKARIPVTLVDLPNMEPPQATLRPPLPRVKLRSDLPTQSGAEDRISNLIFQDADREGVVMREGGPALQAEAIMTLLREQGYLEKSK